MPKLSVYEVFQTWLKVFENVISKISNHLEQQAVQKYLSKATQHFKTHLANLNPKPFTQDSFEQGLLPFNAYVESKSKAATDGWYAGTLHFGIELHRII